MIETEFKALMHCGRYVDANRLGEGIYACDKPFIYSKEDTIETLAERAKEINDMTGYGVIGEKYFESLKQCQLIKIFLTVSYMYE